MSRRLSLVPGTPWRPRQGPPTAISRKAGPQCLCHRDLGAPAVALLAARPRTEEEWNSPSAPSSVYRRRYHHLVPRYGNSINNATITIWSYNIKTDHQTYISKACVKTSVLQNCLKKTFPLLQNPVQRNHHRLNDYWNIPRIKKKIMKI